MNELYNTLLDEKYSKYPYEKSDLKEGMVLVNEVMYQYWKPRYLVDNNTKQAYMFLDGRETLCTITKDDIDFESLRCISRGGGARAYCLDAQYPTQIRNYENGVAEVAWQVTPDGRYFMDEDGFPGKHRPTDYKVGNTWWTDKSAPSLYGTKTHCQGAMTVLKWRQSVIEDWGIRCSWLKNGK